jgi:hypothetical protein
MKTYVHHAISDADTSEKPKSKSKWGRGLRCLILGGVVAPLVIGPVAVMAVVAGPPIPVTVNGTVGNGAEAVDLSGQITIATRIIDDPVFNGPTILELVIDFSSVKGKGKGSGQNKFETEAQTIIHRPLLAMDPIEVTFPYFAGNNMNSAKTAVATLNVSFNAATGVAITSTVKDVPIN